MVDIDQLVFEPPELGCVLSLTGLPRGGSKIYDRSPYGNIGTITGAVWTRLPSGLGVLDFDGIDNYVSCGSPASLDLKNNFTIMMWATALAQNVYMVAWGEGDVGKRRSLYTDGNNFAFSGWGANVISTTIIVNQGYKHLVCNVDASSNVELFVNGVSVKTGSPALVDYATTTTYIGASSPTSGRWTGKIGLVSIYNRVLLASEIQNHYNREKHLFGVW